MMTALAKGKRLEDALRITEQDIIDALNDLPEDKKHCSNLGVRGLKAAIQSYLENAEK
jgi:nitrogen fixation NifU-like protein